MAYAQVAWAPTPVTAGPEMAALAPFFFDASWVGTVYPNMQGPGSPEMRAVGAVTCAPLMDGLWLACDGYQDQFVGDTKLLTWQLHLVIGWDAHEHEYRAVMADSNGTAALLRGTIEGQRLVMTPVGSVMSAGQQTTIRVVWDASDPAAVRWSNEVFAGGAWLLVEDYVMQRRVPLFV